MHSYAQTILQLFSQLQAYDHSATDLALVRNAYELAMVLFSGRFQPSGKTFIAHVVGTASILASLRSPAKLVAAGLLHNVYEHGDFGDGTTGISKAKQTEIRRILGNEVEEYIAGFATLRWNSKGIATMCNGIDNLDPLARDVVLIKLADELEHLLDLDVLYYTGPGYRYYIENGPPCVEIAQKMGLAELAANLEEALSVTTSSTIPEVGGRTLRSGSFVVTPKSYRRNLLKIFRLRTVHKIKRLPSGAIRRAKLRYASLARFVTTLAPTRGWQ